VLSIGCLMIYAVLGIAVDLAVGSLLLVRDRLNEWERYADFVRSRRADSAGADQHRKLTREEGGYQHIPESYGEASPR